MFVCYLVLNIPLNATYLGYGSSGSGLSNPAAVVGTYRCVSRQELVIAAGYRLSRAAELLAEALATGGLYRGRPDPAWLETHSFVVRGLASVAALVVWDRLVSHRCSSQAPRGPGPGGDSGERVDPHLAPEGGGAGGKEGGVG